MRSLSFSLILLAAVATDVTAQGSGITRPIQQARAAVAKADARTEAQQAGGNEPTVRRDSVPVTTAPVVTGTTPSSAAKPAGTRAAAPGKAAAAPAAAATASRSATTPGTATTPASSAGSDKSSATTPAPQAAPGKSLPAGGGKAPAAAPAAAASAPAKDATPRDTTAQTVSVGSQAQTRPELRIDREVFTYDAAGRRDPFVSLFSTSDLRPLFSDLLLVVINYDPQRRNSVAIMRDATTKEQYRVRQGQLIGRMRVAAIEPKRVLFTIDEFGFSRQESLVIGDTTKVRKQ